MLKPTKIMLLFGCLTIIYVTASGFGLHKNQLTSLDTTPNSIGYEYEIPPQDIENSFLALAYEEAISNDAVATAKYLNAYIESTFDFNVLNEHAFDKFSHTQAFLDLKEKYLIRPDVFSIFYFYIACIGFFFTFIILFKRKSDLYSRILIGTFILIHSLFIFEAFLYFSNYRLRAPGIYMISSAVAFLYGPLLFFYFKRVTQQYRFKKIDLLHFIPTVILLMILFPVYSLSSDEKIKIMLGLSKLYKIQDFFFIIFIPKVISLFLYGFFISKSHFNKENRKALEKDCVIYKWENTIYKIHVVYLFSYIIYGLSISEILFVGPSYVYHMQIVAMSAMVTYIIFMVYYEPRVLIIKQISILLNNKYEKSALTSALSLELKMDLIKLLEDEKIYKDNTINLQEISNKLGTTRHNASQVINEHFQMNFFELINKFRIHEAKNLLIEDTNSNLKIIEVAYETGFNNKATFNKAFKKETSLTPSEFIKKHRI